MSNTTSANSTVEMVNDFRGKPLYRLDSAIARVFLACLRPNGATIGEIKKLITSGVAHYPLTRHADSIGRDGIRWDLTVDGKPTGPLKFKNGAFIGYTDSAVIRIRNIRPSGAVVNTEYHRSAPVKTDMALAAIAERANASATESPADVPAVAPVAPTVAETPKNDKPSATTKNGKTKRAKS